MKKTIKLTKKESRSIRMKKWSSVLGTFLMRNASCIACVLVMCTLSASADGTAPADADGAWTQVIEFLAKWIQRLGGAILGLGGILFGMGWRSDDPVQKTNGMNTAIAGGIVLAAATLFKTLAA